MFFKNTGFWKNADILAQQQGQAANWERVTNDFTELWNRASRVAEDISTELPQLTLHDEQHLEAVIDTADFILGPEKILTPMEVFVFGCSVALHDLAHCTTAYAGGLSSIKKTPVWRDAVIELLNLKTMDPDPSDAVIEKPPIEIYDTALFLTLRELHANQAENLLKTKVNLDDGSQYLLENDELRNHYGSVIGKIAASHHWSHSKIEADFLNPLGERAAFRGLGEVRPLLVACLLRTADACQIDQRRAHDAAKKLHKPEGISLLHWQAQNQLAIPTENRRMFPNGVLFTSTKEFDIPNIPSWWTAYELISTADRELRLCKELLLDSGLPTFDKTFVVGANSPAELSRHVRAEGWKPLEDRIRISQPEHIIDTLAGEALYGENYWTPLRELLQNATDAIHSRRAIDLDFAGKIYIAIDQGRWDPYSGILRNRDEGITVHVCDDGIGMSVANIQNYLLDFGASLKRSNVLKKEFPALSGKRLRNIGHFGIGFFSIKMLSRNVWVRSKKYNSAHSDMAHLCFQDDGSYAPFFFNGVQRSEFDSFSTVISIFISNEMLSAITKVSTAVSQIKIGIDKLFAFLCPCLDIDVYVKDRDRKRVLIHSRNWHEMVFEEWLEAHQPKLSFVHNFVRKEDTGKVQNADVLLSSRQGSLEARAALSLNKFGMGFFVEGGLRILGKNQYISDNLPFVGAMAVESKLASRHADISNISQPSLEAFLSYEHFPSFNSLSERELLAAALNLCRLGGDITNFPIFKDGNRDVSIVDLTEMIRSGARIYFPVENYSGQSTAYFGPHDGSKIDYRWNKGVIIVRGFDEVEKDFRGHYFSELLWTESRTSQSIFSQLFASCYRAGFDTRVQLTERYDAGQAEHTKAGTIVNIETSSYLVEVRQEASP
ncbi:HD domain-containing protein [Rhizobium sp. LjRoot254]|uniref:HD domain-containing protein n=1 Tax=Rhizobium sp. LjRoot254 TaxID=3342297 RepID=UPI003ECE6824